MKKILDYRIVKEEHYLDLTDMVNELLREGYKPCGGVSYNSTNDFYIQAMLKDII